jgi:hypothetical protein
MRFRGLAHGQLQSSLKVPDIEGNGSGWARSGSQSSSARRPSTCTTGPAASQYTMPQGLDTQLRRTSPNSPHPIRWTNLQVNTAADVLDAQGVHWSLGCRHPADSPLVSSWARRPSKNWSSSRKSSMRSESRVSMCDNRPALWLISQFPGVRYKLSCKIDRIILDAR